MIQLDKSSEAALAAEARAQVRKTRAKYARQGFKRVEVLVPHNCADAIREVARGMREDYLKETDIL